MLSANSTLTPLPTALGRPHHDWARLNKDEEEGKVESERVGGWGLQDREPEEDERAL
jgi:hypothetical protein